MTHEHEHEPLGVGFKTPGLIDVRSFTTFGFNAKPMTDNPIGFFGTGLKYAIAILMREKIPLVIWIGRNRYEFEPIEEDFRGKQFTAMWMKRSTGLTRHFTKERLPFTTEYGKHWDLWQAFRELESNTRDEQGTTDYIFQDVRKWDAPDGLSTNILVGGQKFLDVYNERDNVFLNKDDLDLRFADTKNGIEVFNSPSKHVYYRGMRAYDLPKNKVSKYTYNFTRAMDLTEDRTLKYAFYMFMYLANLTIECHDKVFIKTIVESDKDSFENEFSFDGSSATPSEEYKSVMRSKGSYLSSASSFYSRYVSPPPKKEPRKRSSRGNEMIDDLAEYLDRHDNGDHISEHILWKLLDQAYEALIGEEPVIIDALTNEEATHVDEDEATEEDGDKAKEEPDDTHVEAPDNAGPSSSVVVSAKADMNEEVPF